MHTHLDRERFGVPERWGGPVRVPLAQSAVYTRNGRGENIQYVVITGAPAVLYALNADTGALRHAVPVPGTNVIWAMAAASDGNLYIGGDSDGMLHRYDPDRRKLEAVGANPCGNVVWDLTEGKGGKLYGATYPESKVFEYDMNTGAFRDMGTMMEGMRYARGIAAAGSALYAGIGPKLHLIRLDKATGEKTEIPIPKAGGKGFVHGLSVYGGKLFLYAERTLHIVEERSGKLLRSIPNAGKISPPSPRGPRLCYYKQERSLYAYDLETDNSFFVADFPDNYSGLEARAFAWLTPARGELAGRCVLAGTGAFTESFLYDPAESRFVEVALEVEPNPVIVNALHAFDGRVYAGGYQRGLNVYEQETGRLLYRNPAMHQPEGIGDLGGAAYIGAYPGAGMYRFVPVRPFDYRQDPEGNPGLAVKIGDGQDRPFAITSGDGKLFVGTFPGYGTLGGALSIVTEDTGADGTAVQIRCRTYRNLIRNQSVVGLAYRDGKLYGGTSRAGGLGIEPAEPEAKLFVFDLAKEEIVAEVTPSIPGVDAPIEMIGDLSFGPDGLLWAAVDGTIIAVNPDTLEIVKSKVVYETKFRSSKFRPFYLRWGKDGLLYTTLGRRLTAVDPSTLQTVQLVDDEVHVMTVGDDGTVYYAVGTELYRLRRLP
ncbi:hypothetical protein GCM10027018_09020 [Paenibacillus thermoaerophilus]